MFGQHPRLFVSFALAASVLAGCSGTGSLIAGGSPLQNLPAGTARQASQQALSMRPIADASHSFIYVADAYANTVWIFPALGMSPQPTGSITQGLSTPEGIAIDKAGTLYVANPSNGNVTEYRAGTTTPSFTLGGLAAPTWVAVDPKGNLWVSSSQGSGLGSVLEFSPGATKPKQTLTGFGQPEGIAFDSRGNLFVADDASTPARVDVFPPGATKPARTFGGHDLAQPHGLVIGPSGDVYVCDYQLLELFVFAHDTYKLVRKVADPQGDLGPVTIATNGRLYLGGDDINVVSELGDYGKDGLLKDQLSNNLNSAFGVAADPAVPAGP